MCEIGGPTIQVANGASIGSAFRQKDSIIGARIAMIGFEVEVV